LLRRDADEMPRIRYQVAVSLDGYIAGPKGDADWIIMDPDIDLDALSAQFDTFIMGRRTFDASGATGSGPQRPSSSREPFGPNSIRT
jgi:dihydrofolate reductase